MTANNIPIQSICIIGGGKMGVNLFFYLLRYNYSLLLLCRDDEQAASLQKKANNKLKRLCNTEFELLEHTNKVRVSINVDDIKNSDLIIECITEDKDKKTELFKQIRNIVKTNCILTTNSSSIAPSALSEVFDDMPVIGMHFFYPVEMQNLVEISINEFSNIDQLRQLTHFLDNVGFRWFKFTEPDIFIANRLLLDCQAEAFNMLSENGINVSIIDSIVKEYLFPVGIFEMFDHVGIDTMFTSIVNYLRGDNENEQYKPMLNILKNMVAEGKLGKKSGAGFYEYTKQCENNVEYATQELKEQVSERLRRKYTASAENFVKQGICNCETIEYIMKIQCL